MLSRAARAVPLVAAAGLCAAAAAAVGCAGNDNGAPGPLAARDAPEVMFLVKNEVMSIHLDGTARRSFGPVGDDRHRAGYPRLLPDGRIFVFADDGGLVFPYTSTGDRDFRRVGDQPAWLGDGACGLMWRGAPTLVYFASAIGSDGSLSTTAMRAATDGSSAEPFGAEDGAALLDPSPDGADHVLAVRAPLDGDDEVRRIDLAAPDPLASAETIARVPFPELLHAPARLPDGRVVFLHFDLRRPDDRGELYLVENGHLVATGITGIVDAEVIGDRVVYEAPGGTGVSDLIATDLVHPPVNLTNTPTVAEHLGWQTE